MIADPEGLLTLAARAEAGGDTTLSDDVWRAMGWERDMAVRDEAWFKPPSWQQLENGEGNLRWRVVGPRPDLCTSIDAQAALPGRVISFWFEPAATTLTDCKIDTFCAEVIGGKSFFGHAPTEPLARLAALLRAMSAKGGGR